MNCIETVFQHQNSYPSWVIDKVIKQAQQAQKVPTNTANENEHSNKKIHRLLLPYHGNESCNIIKSMNKRVNKLLPKNTNIEVTFKSTKLRSCFVNRNFDFFFFFLSVMTNNQTKCGIIYEKIAMREGDDERMIKSGLIHCFKNRLKTER